MRRSFSAWVKALNCFFLASMADALEGQKIYALPGKNLGLVLALTPRGCDASGLCEGAVLVPAMSLGSEASCRVFSSHRENSEAAKNQAWQCMRDTLLERSPRGQALAAAWQKELERAFRSSSLVQVKSTEEQLHLIRCLTERVILGPPPREHVPAVKIPPAAALLVKAERNTKNSENYYLLVNPVFLLEEFKPLLASAAQELIIEIAREIWPLGKSPLSH